MVVVVGGSVVGCWQCQWQSQFGSGSLAVAVGSGWYGSELWGTGDGDWQQPVQIDEMRVRELSEHVQGTNTKLSH